MTFETANRIEQEQGEFANKEAQAVVRGGMTICELTADGRRTYPWIKVLPTQTDAESSIEQALKMRRTAKTTSSKKKQQKSGVNPIKVPDIDLVQIPKDSVSLIENKPFSIDSLISKVKQKLREFMKVLDEIVVE